MIVWDSSSALSRTIVLGVALVAASLGGCGGHPPGGGEGPGEREQPLALSPQQELAVGRRAYQQVLTRYRDRTLPANSPEVIRVRSVLGRIVVASEIEPLQQEIHLSVRDYKFEWEVQVIRERQANAFCLPAGKVVVFTGILDVAGGSDDRLATVLAHEAAHALAHHGSERVARQKTGEAVLRSLWYDRMQESEADHIGIFLLAFAGYDPDEAVTFWERMSQATHDQDRPPEFLSDHPSSETRIRDLRAWAADARAAKAAFDAGRILPAGQVPINPK